MNTDDDRTMKRRRSFRLPSAMVAFAAIAVMACAALAQNAAPTSGPSTRSLPPAAAAADAADPAAAAATADAELTDATPVPAESLYEMFRKGGIFMYPLLACSVIALAIIIERFVALRRGAVIPRRFLHGLRLVYRDRVADRPAALEYCRRKDSAVARMVAAGVRRIPRGQAATEKAIEDSGSNEALKLRRNLRVLYAIGSIATLLGLIGTISGMIQAFRVASGGGLGKSELLAKGIYEAMVCTFGGLAVAIFVTIFYYYFVGKIERLVSDLNDLVNDFAATYTDDLPADGPPVSSAPAVAGETRATLQEFSLAR